MVRHKLDSINECARKGYDIRLTCGGCGHSVEKSAVLLMQAMHGHGRGMSLDVLEARAKCSSCGHRGATAMPVEISW